MRHRRIGGTDAPKVLGVSKYGGGIDVYRRVVDGDPGTIDPFLAKRGRLLEPVIRELSRDLYGWSLRPHPGVLLDPRRDWCASSPDDLLADDEAGVDYKSVDPRAAGAYGEEGTDDVPLDVYLQCVHYMAALELPRWHVVAYFGGNDLRRYTLHRDGEIEATWEKACSEFWRLYILPRRPPPPDASDSYLAWLMERRPKELGPVARASAQAEDWAARLREARKAKAAAEELEAEARNHLVAELGSAQRLLGDGWSLSTQSRKSTAWKAAAEAARIPQDIVEQHTTSTTFPVFREQKGKQQ